MEAGNMKSDIMESEKKYRLLQNSLLFQDISRENLGTLLSCLDTHEKRYAKDSFIYLAGDRARDIGMVLEGRVCIIREDYTGNRHIVSEVGEGELFAEAFSCAGGKKIPFYVVSVTESVVLYINYHRVVTTCPASCVFHGKLIENMVSVLAGKNIQLTMKLGHVTQKTTRDKLLSYLLEQERLQASPVFKIPFDRQQLADYLGIDRSAMSHELGKMKKEKIIDFHKNQFRFLHGSVPQ